MPIKRRLEIVAGLALLPLAPLSARLAQLQVLEHRKLAAMASGELEREALEIIPRGRILDRSGKVLVESMPSWSAFFETAGVKDPPAAASSLAAILGLERADILRKLKSGSRFVWLKRKLSPEEVARLKALRIQGVGLAPDERRVYPNGELARSLLGAVGTDGKGLSGLELAFDAQLSGKAQKASLIRDGAGKVMEAAPRRPVEPPPDLRLTIERNIQYYAEEALAEASVEQRATGAVLLVEDPRTGDILGMASYPPDRLRNAAVQDVYEPGSTFKAVTMTAALEEELTSPEEVIDCAGPWEISPSVFVKDHEPLGPLTASAVMERSSNVGMAKLGLRLGAERFYRHARAFGFGAKTGLALPGESAGLLKTPDALGRIVLGNNAFGQGLGATPLQILSAYSAIANGGVLLEPRLVAALAPGGQGRQEPPVKVRRVARADTIAKVARMLEGVVERGTGLSAAVPGFSVAGKTGTAQKLDPRTRRYSSTDYVASFAGWAPASDPRYAVLVVIDGPKKQYYGSEVAAPVFSKLMKRILALGWVEPDRPLPVHLSQRAARPAPAALFGPR